MNCVTCQFDYLMDKTAMLDARTRRMHNVMDKGGLSAEVTDVQHANVREIQEFETKWNAARCAHGGAAGERVHEAGKGSAGATVAVETPVANIGVSSLTTSRPTATNKPPQGNKAGRYVGSGGGSGSGGGRGKR